MNEELANNLSKLLQVFNGSRSVTEAEVKQIMMAMVVILAENKRSTDALNEETRKRLEDAINSIAFEHQNVLESLRKDVVKSKAEIEKAAKEQNDRAFRRLQELINKTDFRIPRDGLSGKDGKDGRDGEPGPAGTPGKDGSPDTPEQVRDKLETLKDDERLDVKAIRGLPDYLQEVKKKGRQMPVGGIRFFENLADVSIPITSKRKDLIAQYSTTNNRWESGIALTVSATEPASPQANDVWIDIS